MSICWISLTGLKNARYNGQDEYLFSDYVHKFSNAVLILTNLNRWQLCV
jgi:hypothetical protein